ncbi:MAG: hypothetical protein FWG14_05955 [Peptococcaceae bacterium]|nr:hypothetical protein [Peptococcaceae bacterium]
MVDALWDGVRKGNIAHFYLFYGETRQHREQALTLAAALNCLAGHRIEGYNQHVEGNRLRFKDTNRVEKNPLDSPLFCGQCVACRKVFSGCHPDVEIIGPAKSSIGIDQVVALQKKVARKPYEGAYKVYIIEDAEKMTLPAANALLVTAEEPPEYIVLVVSCASDAAILPTLRSRARAVYFPPEEETRGALHIGQGAGGHGIDGQGAMEETDWAEALDLSGGNAGLAREVARVGSARIRDLMGLYEKAVEARDFLRIFSLFPLERDVAFVWLQVMAAGVVAYLKGDAEYADGYLEKEGENNVQIRMDDVQLEEGSWRREAARILPWIEEALRALQRQADVRLTIEVLALKHMRS